jgi:transcriptional regulator with XRE-family HTH domain
MAGRRESFGALLRRERKAKEIGLRDMARRIDVSPAYLSKVERGDFAPPAEDKVRAIAWILGQDADDLLLLSGRVPGDLVEIIRKGPRQLVDLVRAADGVPAGDLVRATVELTKRKAVKGKRRAEQGRQVFISYGPSTTVS